MAVDKFKFISPGIFISEIDESQNPVAPPIMGPIIVGRTTKGPAMRPVQVKSYQEYVEVFGRPYPGGASGGDVWRSNSFTGPTYAAYAAKAWLGAGTAPVTVVRLLGEDNENSDTTYQAGWTTQEDPDRDWAAHGGAHGLFVIDSGTSTQWHTGTLAAIFYLDSGSMLALSGTLRSGTSGPLHDNTAETFITASAGAFIKSSGTGNNFHLQLYRETGLTFDFGTVNFDKSSMNYIRKVMNTTPSLINTDITVSGNLNSGEQHYWLGETFERSIERYTESKGSQWGMILPLMSGATVGWHDRQSSWDASGAPAQTNWFFSQHFGSSGSFDALSNVTKLFKFHALDYGSWPNANLKIAIEDIRAGTTPTSPWGSFTVAVYPASAYDSSAQALEKFTQCDINPESPNYVAIKIGDQNLSWSDTEKIHTQNGEHANKSKYIRIETNPVLDAGGVNQASLPFGIPGPIRPKGFSYTALSASLAVVQNGFFSASTVLHPFNYAPGSPNSGDAAPPSWEANVHSSTYVTGGFPMPNTINAVFAENTCGAIHVGGMMDRTPDVSAGVSAGSGSQTFSGSWVWPAVAQRSSSNDASDALGKSAFFGVQATHNATSQFDPGYGDYLRGLPFDSTVGGRHESLANGAPGTSEFSWVFSLDQISASAGTYYHQSGSRMGDGTATNLGTSLTAEADSYKAVLDEGINKFWAPMYGGFDGLDVTEAEPFRNSQWGGTTTNLNSYSFNSVQKAIHAVADPEAVECNLMVVPGITNTKLTDLVLNTCRDRADALAIVDIEGVFTPATENKDSYADRLGSVSTTVSNIQARDINNSYGCVYYPWVQIKDAITGRLLQVPPSVVALGTFASSEASSELWFAPAGFNRGGLTAPGKGGAAGLKVVNVTERVTSKKRDDLYENNINPIAKFPGEGIVVFGQKTLQQTSSALDRINVRRLMIYCKKEISRIAATILFDQNVEVTWQRFTGQAEPFLSDVKARFGLTDFKVVLDETTTTPDLIDRNVMYAKIYLKPARAIEYIAIDFIVTRTGASFAD